MRLRKSDDPEAWAEFDSIYRPMLMRYAQSRALPEADADDVIQHCMAVVHRRIGTFEYNPQLGRFKVWLFTIFQNRLRNMIRDRREAPIDTEILDAVPSESISVDEVFERMWVDQHLEFGLRKIREEIGEPLYAAFHRYAIDNENSDAVCNGTGLRPPQLYKLKWKVIQRLKEILRDILGTEYDTSGWLS